MSKYSVRFYYRENDDGVPYIDMFVSVVKRFFNSISVSQSFKLSKSIFELKLQQKGVSIFDALWVLENYNIETRGYLWEEAYKTLL